MQSILLGKLQGSKTYAVGFLLLLNTLFTLVTGEQVPTFDNPAAGADAVLSGGLGAGLMTIRAAVAELSKRLDTLVPKPPAT